MDEQAQNIKVCSSNPPPSQKTKDFGKQKVNLQDRR